MSLMLSYRGPLPPGNARSRSNAAKNHIRRVLHPQLLGFAKSDFHFSYAATPPGAAPVFRGIRFSPVVSDDLLVELRIEILRREPPGGVVSRGDLDGRIKTLIDGLRMPKHDTEVVGFKPTGDRDKDWCLCLLIDDRIITKIDVGTHRTFEPLPIGADASDVDVRIDVLIKLRGTF